MKILFVSLHSIHAIRWLENLKDTSFELYWFDVLGRGNLLTINPVHQFTDWEQRKLPYMKGEYFLSKKLPSFYEKIESFLKVTANEQLEKIINEIQPDVIHSFEMQYCSYPIIKTMNKYPNIKWVYSCWGNDLYYYRQFSKHQKKIKKALARVDYLHTDCKRDIPIAKELGFKGIHLGVIPGGAGFRLEEYDKLKCPIKQRKTIIVKGYQHHFGRGLTIVKALSIIQSEIQDYDVVVFGAHNGVVEFVNENKLPFQVYSGHGLKHIELLEIMGKSLIYIGNSISDGIPNTLYGAMVMGSFPIQSNPGGSTEEIITDGKNGLLIKDPESTDEIIAHIRFALSNPKIIENAIEINNILVKEILDYELNKKKIIAIYENIKINNQ